MPNPFRTRSQQIQAGGLSTEILYFSFLVGAVGAPSRIRDGRGNLVASVTRTAAGKYTVQLNKPYPRQIIAVVPTLSEAAGYATKMRKVREVADSYTSASGQIKLECLSITDLVAPVIEDMASGDVIHVQVVAQVKNQLVQS